MSLSILQKQFAQRVQIELADLRFFVLSDVWLDRPETLHGLRKLFDNCMENSFIPKVVVLCGNFTSVGIPQGNGREVRRYQGPFVVLAHWYTVLKLCREFRGAGRPDSKLSPNNSHHPFRPRTWPSGCHIEHGIAQETTPLLLC